MGGGGEATGLIGSSFTVNKASTHLCCAFTKPHPHLKELNWFFSSGEEASTLPLSLKSHVPLSRHIILSGFHNKSLIMTANTHSQVAPALCVYMCFLVCLFTPCHFFVQCHEAIFKVLSET